MLTYLKILTPQAILTIAVTVIACAENYSDVGIMASYFLNYLLIHVIFLTYFARWLQIANGHLTFLCYYKTTLLCAWNSLVIETYLNRIITSSALPITQITIATIHWTWVQGSIGGSHGVVDLITNKARIALELRYRAVLYGRCITYSIELPCDTHRHAGVVEVVTVIHRRTAAGLAWTWIISAWIAAYAESCWKIGDKTAQKTQCLQHKGTKTCCQVKGKSLA